MTRLLVCMGLLLVVPVVAVAQAPLDDNSRRLLNGYYFIPSTDVASPFVTSFVRSATGVGVAVGLTVPIEDLDGNVVDSIGGDLAFLILDFQYQQAITKWLAIRAGFTGSARVGTDEQSLLTQGITSVYGFDLGATAQLLQTRSFLLSAVVNYTSNQIYAIAPFDFLKSVIDSGFDPGGDNNLLQSGSAGLTSGGLRMAFAPSDLIGFTALAEAGIGERFVEEAGTRGTVRLAGTVGVDLGSRTNVPVGLLAGYRYQSFSDNADDIVDDSWRVSFRVSYTGRDDFNIGLEAAFARLNLVGGSDNIESTLGRLALRYFF